MSVVPTIRMSDLFVVLIAGLAFTGSFNFNQYFDGYFVYAPGISLLFIPAGVKLLLVLVGRLPAVIGILIVSVYLGAGIWPDKSLLTVFIFAFVSLITYPIAAYLVMQTLGIHRDLTNLRYWHIVALSLSASILNGTVHNLIYLWQGVIATEDLWSKSSAMAFGDFFGCLVVVGIFHTVMLSVKQFPQKTII
jgi:glucose-6-phosphate-specific signal transduction histidine kinase